MMRDDTIEGQNFFESVTLKSDYVMFKEGGGLKKIVFFKTKIIKICFNLFKTSILFKTVFYFIGIIDTCSRLARPKLLAKLLT